MSTVPPRAVFVTRETDYELLIARHATREQARFFLERRGQKLTDVEARHERFRGVLRDARSGVPANWRQALVRRADLDRFLFAPEDVIVVVGQDGLVANVAKYLAGQPVLGVNPLPDLYDGILVRVPLDRLAVFLPAAVNQDIAVETRTMAEAVMDSGERLVALNEIFIGHRSHQSARYVVAIGSTAEEQSSSGIIAATGTGATGWARSIMEATDTRIALDAQERAIAYFVREPFPSVATGTSIRAGKLDLEPLRITSRMNDGGVIFADGIEQDFIGFDWGRQVVLKPSTHSLRLITAR
jgi:NAD kinase